MMWALCEQAVIPYYLITYMQISTAETSKNGNSVNIQAQNLKTAKGDQYNNLDFAISTIEI